MSFITKLQTALGLGVHTNDCLRDQRHDSNSGRGRSQFFSGLSVEINVHAAAA
ncbi:MAG TPA: hypothetical protein VGN90_18555 [Pyrinomonadaceae bacterium]|jgi:hypothetical protein|nr:hypothetical protein [Pyrinomonadaceae bacterium]